MERDNGVVGKQKGEKIKKEEVLEFLELSKGKWAVREQTHGSSNDYKIEERNDPKFGINYVVKSQGESVRSFRTREEAESWIENGESSMLRRGTDPWASHNIPGGIPGTEKVYTLSVPTPATSKITSLDFPGGKREVQGFEEGIYQSPHFQDKPNVVLHFRTQEIADSKGEKGLLAETIQSDWHQARVPKEEEYYRQQVPDAPFEKTWPEIGLKHLIDIAAQDPSIKWVGWSGGKVQNERWGKSGPAEFDLDNPAHEAMVDEFYDSMRNDFVKEKGREPTEKEEEYMYDDATEAAMNDFEAMQAEGKTGEGSFLTTLYDKRLPKFAKKYAEKMGGRYATSVLKPGKTDMSKGVYISYGDYPIHRIDLTPAMRQKVNVEGQEFYDPIAGAVGAGIAGAVLGGDKKKKGENIREDGTLKGPGWLGSLPMKDGRTATEMSIGVRINGKETLIPVLVPGLTKREIDHLLSGNKPTDAILRKAVFHARQRIRKGKSPFKEGVYKEEGGV